MTQLGKAPGSKDARYLQTILVPEHRLQRAAAATDTSIVANKLPKGTAADRKWAVLMDPTTPTHTEIRRVETLTAGNIIGFTTALSYAHAAGDPIIWLDKPIANVKWFGATGNASTDDTDSIQAALDSYDYPTVFLPTGNYYVTNISLGHATILVGDGLNVTRITGTATAGNVIDVSAVQCEIAYLTVTATATRQAVAHTVYDDSTPTAGKHGIFLEPSLYQTCYRPYIHDVVVEKQPDDGIMARKPEMMRIENVYCEYNGRYGCHMNGYIDGNAFDGISNYTMNLRVLGNGYTGLYVRDIEESTFVHIQALLNGTFTEQIFFNRGRGNKLINPDVEDTDFNSGIGIRLIGGYHEVSGGLITKHQTPYSLESAWHCRIRVGYVTNTGYTAADQLIKIDSASSRNRIECMPASSYGNVTATFSIHASSYGNICEVAGSGPFVYGVRYINTDDATPDVSLGDLFLVAQTGTPAAITNFDGNIFPGQTKRFIFQNGNSTIDFTSSNLKGNGGADWTPATNDRMTCTFDGTNWYCDISDNSA